MTELVLRFLIGGLVVSAFAVLGDLLRPKIFAGLFGAAPSIALATVGITIALKGEDYAATEVRSMVLGAIAFCVYAHAVSWMLMRFKRSAMVTTVLLLPVWFGVSFGLWWGLLR